MAMVCPQCNRSFEQRLHCPGCEVRLLYVPTPRKQRHSSADDVGWERTHWGIFIVGILLAQGLYHMLRQLLAAGILVTWQGEADNVWTMLGNLLLLQALQEFCVFTAAGFTGAGRRRGFLIGAAIGAWSGILFILFQQWSGQYVSAVSVLGEPILEAAFGGLGGLVGSLIWKPVSFAVPSGIRQPSRPVVQLMPARVAFGGPVAWTRVLTGIVLAAGGVIWADIIREFVLDASSGKLKIDTELQAQLVIWEISALALFAGGALAGATTRNGLTQGLWVGVCSGALLFGIRVTRSELSFQLVFLTVIVTVCLALAGGWFGSQLLPPVRARSRRRGLMPAG
jgi:hypothetical protein